MKITDELLIELENEFPELDVKKIDITVLIFESDDPHILELLLEVFPTEVFNYYTWNEWCLTTNETLEADGWSRVYSDVRIFFRAEKKLDVSSYLSKEEILTRISDEFKKISKLEEMSNLSNPPCFI